LKAPKKRYFLFGLFLLFACNEAPEWTTVIVGLDTVPENVSTLSIFIQNIEEEELVTSTTVAANQTSVLLGVPAEVPLLFTAVAYTLAPGPKPLKNMPAYVARNQRTVPLNRDRVQIPLRAVRAGVLTARVLAPKGQDTLPEDLSLSLSSAQSPVPLLPIALPDDRGRFQPSFVLPVGHYGARLESKNDEDSAWIIQNPEGLFVAPEFESITTLRVFPNEETNFVQVPKVSLEIRTTNGATLADNFRLEAQSNYSLSFSFELEDQAVPALQLASWTISSVPSEAFVGPSNQSAGRLQNLSEPGLDFSTGSSGRAEIVFDFEFADGRRLHFRENFVALSDGQSQGKPVDLKLSLVESAALNSGTDLRIELLDENGLYAKQVSGSIDLGESDDWLLLQEGPAVDLFEFGRGLVYRQVARPSGPRGLGVVARATLTSTNLPNTITSTLGLPVLELEN